MPNVNVADVVLKAQVAAAMQTNDYLQNHLMGDDGFPCGFAWIRAMVDGRTRIGKELMKAGFEKDYGKPGLMLWNPSGSPLQNVDAKLAGAKAAAQLLSKELGIQVVADSRWD